jgi:poly(beta-D-mannuronate) lyase
LSQDTTKTGIAVRKWTLASLAASYLRLSIAPTQETQKIESWLSKIANQVISEYDFRPVRLRNNHDYWAYWSVMNVSAITQDALQYQWALNKWVEALEDIDANGFLHNEMQRGAKAREYHNFAAMPLVGSATFIATNSPKVFERHSESLLRLVKRLANNISQNHDFAPEQPPFYDMLSNGRLAWLPMFLSITRYQKASVWKDFEQLSEQHPPAGYSRLGGNTLKYYNY